MDNKTDEEIALQVQKGDVDSFGVIMERYEQKMLRYAKKFLIDDDNAQSLVQDVFLKTYTNINSFDTKRRFSPWLYRIAHNEFINAIKKKARDPLFFFSFDEIFPHPISPDKTDSEAISNDLKKTLDACLDELDPKYKEPLILHNYEDLDYQEISEIMKIPVSTVGVRLKRGRDMLKKIYDNLNKNGTK